MCTNGVTRVGHKGGRPTIGAHFPVTTLLKGDTLYVFVLDPRRYLFIYVLNGCCSITSYYGKGDAAWCVSERRGTFPMGGIIVRTRLAFPHYLRPTPHTVARARWGSLRRHHSRGAATPPLKGWRDDAGITVSGVRQQYRGR